MWRLLIVLLLFEGILTAFAASAQSLPSKKEMAALLEKAESQETFAAEGTPPFHIVASVRNTMEAHGKPPVLATGTYEIFWADPGRYREEFRLGMIWETDVASETELYLQRSSPFLPYSLWLLRRLTTLPVRQPELLKREKPKLESVRLGSAGSICAELELPAVTLDPFTAIDVTHRQERLNDLKSVYQREVCLDPTTHQITSRHYVTRLAESVFDDYVDFGPARYPRHIVLKELGSTSEIKVEKLEPVDHFAADAFVAPSGSARRDWCPAPQLKIRPGNDRFVISMFTGPDFVYSVLVGTDGKAEKVTRLFPDGKFDELDAKEYPWRFAARDCAGKAIEYETIMSKQSISYGP